MVPPFHSLTVQMLQEKAHSLVVIRFHADRLLSDGFVVDTKCLPGEQWPLCLLTCLFVMGLRSRVHFYKYIMGGVVK